MWGPQESSLEVQGIQEMLSMCSCPVTLFAIPKDAGQLTDDTKLGGQWWAW